MGKYKSVMPFVVKKGILQKQIMRRGWSVKYIPCGVDKHTVNGNGIVQVRARGAPCIAESPYLLPSLDPLAGLDKGSR